MRPIDQLPKQSNREKFENLFKKELKLRTEIKNKLKEQVETMILEPSTAKVATQAIGSFLGV